MNFFKNLPSDIRQLIYSYDNTYKEIFTAILKRYLPRKKIISPHQAREKKIFVIDSICRFGKEIGRDITNRTILTMILNEDKYKLKNLGNHRITYNIFRYIVRQFGRDIVIEEYSHPMYHNKKSAHREYLLGERSWWKDIQRRYIQEHPMNDPLSEERARDKAWAHCHGMTRWNQLPSLEYKILYKFYRPRKIILKKNINKNTQKRHNL